MAGKITLGLLLLVVCWTLTLAIVNNNGTEDAEEEETFEDVEKKFKNAASSAVKMILPYLLRGSSDAKVSGQCTASIMKIIGGVRSLREWA
ncbi:hypothetical protein X975_12671, partial [Stegodyphus mimosarum]